MPNAILTPFVKSAAQKAGQVWRKKVLPVGIINYKGRVLSFSKRYNDELAHAFTQGAYPQVPFQLADAANTHTNDPERFRGDIVNMSSEEDGLWISLRPTERGEQVLRENPQLGVSARIVEDYDRSDGRFFPKAIQHVLGTLDPRIPGLGAWQVVEAANSGDVAFTLDLSGESFAGTEREAGSMPEMTAEQQARLARLLEIPADKFEQFMAGLTAPQLSDEELARLAGQDDGTGSDQFSDEELESLIAAAAELDGQGLLEDDQLAGAGAGAQLSAQAHYAIELAHSRNDETERQLGIINAELDRQRFQAERMRLVNDCGVAPFLVDLAQPLLEGTGHVVELSNPAPGQAPRVDAGQIARKLLTEFGRMSGMLDLSEESGSPFDEPEGDSQAKTARQELVGRARSQMGL